MTKSQQLIQEYRLLVARQREMPESEQWTMGAQLRHLIARIEAEREYEKLNLR